MRDQYTGSEDKKMDTLGTHNVDRDKVYQENEQGIRDKDENINDREKSFKDEKRRGKEKALSGVFETENEAIKVIKQLKEIGYHEDDITVVAKDKDKMDRLDDETGVDTKSQGDSGKVEAGAATGGALGAIAAAVPALGLLAIPGIGPILAAGPIVGILGGAIAGGVAGGLIGALIELGVKEENAKKYREQIEQGKIVVLVENREDLQDEVYATYSQNNSVIDSRTSQR